METFLVLNHKSLYIIFTVDLCIIKIFSFCVSEKTRVQNHTRVNKWFIFWVNRLLYFAARQHIFQIASWIRPSGLRRPWLQRECRYFSECLSLPSWSFPFRKHSLFFHSSHFCILKTQSILPAPFSLFRCLFLSFKFCVLFTSQGTRKKTDEKRDSKSKGGWKWLKVSADWKRMW